MEAKMNRHLLRMRFVLRLALLIMVMLLLASSAVQADSQVLNIFLVQNSGWMEPFYLNVA